MCQEAREARSSAAEAASRRGILAGLAAAWGRGPARSTTHKNIHAPTWRRNSRRLQHMPGATLRVEATLTFHATDGLLRHCNRPQRCCGLVIVAALQLAGTRHRATATCVERTTALSQQEDTPGGLLLS